MKRIALNNCRLARLQLHIIPILVWLAALAGVVCLFRYRTERFELVGLAQGQIRQVAAPCDWRLKVVTVELFEPVKKGEILAMLDDEQLNAQTATISAEIERLMAELISTQEKMVAEASIRENDWVAAMRRFYVDAEQCRLRILGLKTVLETDRITLLDLALEVKIADELLKKDAIAPYDLQKAQTSYDALSKKIEENQNLLEQAEKDLNEALQRRDEFAKRRPNHPPVDSALEPIRKAITVQEKLIAELMVKREALTIKSPLDGVVVQIQPRRNEALLRRPGEAFLRRPGEFVQAGEPIMAITEADPSEIIAYAGEMEGSEIQAGKAVQLFKSSLPPQVTSSQVTHVGSTIEIMPERLWRTPNTPQWGRPIVITIPPGIKLVQGETVGIRGL